MARPTDQQKRAELLAAVVEYIATNGLDNLTLRPLAASLGTSSRMLIYYFESREKLIVQALASQRPAFSEMFGDVHDRAGLRSRLRELWESMTIGDDAASSRILMQVIGIASINDGVLGEFASATVHSLTGALSSALERCGLGADDALSRATLLGAGFRGLLLDRFTTEEADRTDKAAAALFELIVGT